MRIDVKPEMLSWAYERAGFGPGTLSKRFPKLDAWENGKEKPTFKQLEAFSKAMHAPIGYLFLKEPPIERIPIPDFRTIGKEHAGRPSPELLDTVYICQQRQEWYHDYLKAAGEEQLQFVGSVRLSGSIELTATQIRQSLGFNIEERRRMPTWTDALRRFIEQADNFGIMVMCSGVVLNNNRRHLNPDEFRGFAMADSLAPLVFINGADTKAAQMFTLAHELAHIWLGQSAVSDAQASTVPDHEVELWCNRVAAEVLVPLDNLHQIYQNNEEVYHESGRLARYFKVSTLVILRRIFDAGYITKRQFEIEYQDELERLHTIPKGSGGNFYLTQASRVGKRFARALITSTLEGQTLHRDAFQLLGFTKLETFHELGRNLGVTF